MSLPAEEAFAWSIRMRAAAGGSGGRHLSGAERLVLPSELDATLSALTARTARSGADPDFMQVTLDRIALRDIGSAPVLPVTSVQCPTPDVAGDCAASALAAIGISARASAIGFALLSGESRIPPLRGAAIFDSQTGERLDRVLDRGVRVTRMDYAPDERKQIDTALAAAGLVHFRVPEALAVATKVQWAGVLAEICWSDDPDYLTGYVATRDHGYLRLENFKPRGAPGGRSFFIDSKSTGLDGCIHRLEQAALWIHGPLAVRRTSENQQSR